ncbi:hypothetical protein E2C01_049768 [Portunus trituberculatus]|uniref:Uncharacterized protein n=1 Tax=Portunus trituberculatus TaxID=210409 RepID=A0A5B7GER6_PORTR|nr:hypothetical protein [Portunus trituberculatus]
MGRRVWEFRQESEDGTKGRVVVTAVVKERSRNDSLPGPPRGHKDPSCFTVAFSRAPGGGGGGGDVLKPTGVRDRTPRNVSKFSECDDNYFCSGQRMSKF